MSIETIKTEIIRFLESETSEVMAIKGKWGTGKTHLWNKLLKENKDKIKFEKYSYISLFGINSLDVFKYAIFENIVSRNSIGEEFSIENFTEIPLQTLSKLAKPVAELFNKGKLVESYPFLSVNRTLICIDDLERKGEGLKLKDVPIASLFFAKDSFDIPASESAKNYATSFMPSAAPIRPSMGWTPLDYTVSKYQTDMI